MTREEAINILEMFLHKQCDLKRTEFAYDANTIWHAVNMASKALEQEPCCNDCISRQAVNDLYDRYHSTLATCVYEFGEELKALPSVNPTREHGEWIEEKHGYRCNKCNRYYKGEWSIKNNAMMPHKYCPNCGAKMESEG